jgi:ketosteroid isomerase-like protein
MPFSRPIQPKDRALRPLAYEDGAAFLVQVRLNPIQHIDENISLSSITEVRSPEQAGQRAAASHRRNCAGAARMSASRRSKNTSAQAHGVVHQTVAELVQRSAEGNSALMRGDIRKYYEVIPHTDDFMLMSPFGGEPTRASELTAERIESMGRFFKNGTFEQELVQAYASADMVVLAMIERPHVEVGGLPAQDWALRVTLVYRREGAQWRLAHRHADPLAKGISLEQAAALSRGEAA